MTREDKMLLGVRDAWDFWLSQHPISIAEIIHDAIKEAVTEWLDRHPEAVEP